MVALTSFVLTLKGWLPLRALRSIEIACALTSWSKECVSVLLSVLNSSPRYKKINCLCDMVAFACFVLIWNVGCPFELYPQSDCVSVLLSVLNSSPRYKKINCLCDMVAFACFVLIWNASIPEFVTTRRKMQITPKNSWLPLRALCSQRMVGCPYMECCSYELFVQLKLLVTLMSFVNGLLPLRDLCSYELVGCLYELYAQIEWPIALISFVVICNSYGMVGYLYERFVLMEWLVTYTSFVLK
ncbi:uncharacterized protein G2W53_007212 [Senna tora]|uniref:Uncharacterized protein n=1 Tax=Senna tora TaxID=362788 RepID=A0A834X6B0_9FABA|nr:uncharacterized protein G2W53_007212 [Senna tora]